MGEFELNEKAKTEFLNLPVIKSNFVSCWFDGQKLVMPSGQGKTLKGVVLASLEVFKSQQSKIEQLEKKINNCENLLTKWKSQGVKGCSDYARGGLHTRQDCEDALAKALRGDYENQD